MALIAVLSLLLLGVGGTAAAWYLVPLLDVPSAPVAAATSSSGRPSASPERTETPEPTGTPGLEIGAATIIGVEFSDRYPANCNSADPGCFSPVSGSDEFLTVTYLLEPGADPDDIDGITVTSGSGQTTGFSISGYTTSSDAPTEYILAFVVARSDSEFTLNWPGEGSVELPVA